MPWPGRRWEIVASGDPGVASIRFPAFANGRHVLATASTDGTQVKLEAPGCPTLELPLEVWMQVGPTMTALAHKHPPALPPACG